MFMKKCAQTEREKQQWMYMVIGERRENKTKWVKKKNK